MKTKIKSHLTAEQIVEIVEDAMLEVTDQHGITLDETKPLRLQRFKKIDMNVDCVQAGSFSFNLNFFSTTDMVINEHDHVVSRLEFIQALTKAYQYEYNRNTCIYYDENNAPYVFNMWSVMMRFEKPKRRTESWKKTNQWGQDTIHANSELYPDHILRNGLGDFHDLQSWQLQLGCLTDDFKSFVSTYIDEPQDTIDWKETFVKRKIKISPAAPSWADEYKNQIQEAPVINFNKEDILVFTLSKGSIIKVSAGCLIANYQRELRTNTL